MKNYTSERAMAEMRGLILDRLYRSFPVPAARPAVLQELRPSFSTQTEEWLNDAMSEQLKVLAYAGLIKTAAKGFTLTSRGMDDRRQAARFLNKNAPEPA